MHELFDRGDRDRFEAVAASGTTVGSAGLGHRALALAASARGGSADAAIELSALWLHAAVAAPASLVAVYDASATGWLGNPPDASPISMPIASGVQVPDEFWPAFWSLVFDPQAGQNASEITVRTAALTGMLSPELADHLVASSACYPGVGAAAAAGFPVQFTLPALARCPKGSLGGDLHDLIVDNNFDLEVLDRDALGLAGLPAPLDYVNARILQCHDLWHLLAGYRTTVLHEIAISGFQMAQFGHHYSSLFLATVATKVSLTQPLGVALIFDTILSAYVHGRETPPMLGFPWEEIWDSSADEIRSSRGVRTYASPYPADLFEQLQSA